MSRSYRKIIRNRKARIARRLEGRGQVHAIDEGSPVLAGSNIHYEFSEKVQGMNYGGIGAIHQMVRKIGLLRRP